VKQINLAVAQLNQVTQQTAATSEETASAVAQLTSQATDMQALVHTFRLSQTEQVEKLVCLESQTLYQEHTTISV
jgi:hypothetical protein